MYLYKRRSRPIQVFARRPLEHPFDFASLGSLKIIETAGWVLKLIVYLSQQTKLTPNVVNHIKLSDLWEESGHLVATVVDTSSPVISPFNHRARLSKIDNKLGHHSIIASDWPACRRGLIGSEHNADWLPSRHMSASRSYCCGLGEQDDPRNWTPSSSAPVSVWPVSIDRTKVASSQSPFEVIFASSKPAATLSCVAKC